MSYKSFTYTVPANGEIELVRQGTFFSLLESKLPLNVSFDDGSPSEMDQGLTLKFGTPFQRVRISNPDPANAPVIKIGIGEGDIRDSRVTVVGGVVVKTANEWRMGAALTVDPNTSELALAAKSYRQEVIINNKSDYDIWAKPGASVAERGLRIKAQTTERLQTQDDVYIINPAGSAGAAAVDVSYTINTEV